jgi:signal transduction histidine kinase
MPPRGVRRINGKALTVASIVLVVLCYVAAVGSWPLDPVALGITSAVYLIGLLVGPIACERHERGRLVYFSLQLAVTAALVAHGPGAMLLATMALVSHAVVYLERKWAALVIGLVFAMTLACIATFPDWPERLNGLLNYLTALVFVIGFSRMAAGHYDARQRATELALELAAANDRVAQLASTNERNRIAREVHDGLGHSLTVAHLQLEAARESLHADPARTGQILARVQSVIQAGLRDVRSSVGLLRDESRPRGVTEALSSWASELRTDGIAVALDVSVTLPSSPATAHVLYRAAQEAVTNIRKHAGARSVEIAMAPTAAGWKLRIADDGRGAIATDSGYGLAGIRERVTALGGSVAIDTAPGRGFALTLELPST